MLKIDERNDKNEKNYTQWKDDRRDRYDGARRFERHMITSRNLQLPFI